MLIPLLEDILESNFRLILPKSIQSLRVSKEDAFGYYIIGPAGPGYISYQHKPELAARFAAVDIDHQQGQFTGFTISDGVQRTRVYLHHKAETMPNREYALVPVDEYIRREAMPEENDIGLDCRLLMLGSAATNRIQ